MTVTIVTNHRTVRLIDVLSIERETYFDARYNEYETTYYITTRPYEYMYYTTISEQIKEVIIEE